MRLGHRADKANCPRGFSWYIRRSASLQTSEEGALVLTQEAQCMADVDGAGGGGAESGGGAVPLRRDADLG